MQNLTAFHSPWSQVAVLAELENRGERLSLKFELKDPLNLIQSSSQFFQKGPRETLRKDELWKATCFELFLKVPERTSYYEFNFSTEGFWNVYEFTDYRKPHPPLRSEAFGLEEWSWRSQVLRVTLVNKTPVTNWSVSMTAVLQNLNQEVQYWALKHADEKPNFHHFDSFLDLKTGDSL
jgi:hypothetical protein